MQIKKIVRLKDCGVFSDFQWPADLPEFGRYNLVYGWNGTGKTTITRVLASLESKTSPKTGEITLLLDDLRVRGADFPSASSEVRVFNRDFVEQQVFQSGGGGIPLVVVFGQENIEKQARLDTFADQLIKERDDEVAKREAVRIAKKAVDDYMTARAEVIRETLGAEDAEFYRKYIRTTFKNRVSQLRENGEVPTLLSDAEIRAAESRRDAQVKDKLDEGVFTPPDLGAFFTKVTDLIGMTPASKLLSQLVSDPELQRWVGLGVDIHQKRGKEQCLFCHSQIGEDRWSALALHFDDSYRQLAAEVNSASRQLEDAKDTLDSFALPVKSELQDHLQEKWEKSSREFADQRALAGSALETLIVALEKKAQDLSDKDVALPTKRAVSWSCLEDLRLLRTTHNEGVDNIAEVRLLAREQLEMHHIAASLSELEEREELANKAEEAVQESSETIAELDSKIATLQVELSQPEKAAVEMTNDLHAYLGRDDLAFRVRDGGYAVMRGDEPADLLSEGEKTAIAVLYFLKTLDDESFDLEKGIVVLDDPVSSLDNQALFLAFGYIRDRTKKAGQLFVFTHNWQFFSLVKQWLLTINGEGSNGNAQLPGRFQMVECDVVDGVRRARLKGLDPLLASVESEYHYMFSLVNRASKRSSPSNLVDYYVLPNVARRLLESFLAFQYPTTGTQLSKALGSIQVESWRKPKIERIRRFLNLESHGEAIGNSEKDPSLLAEAPEVMADVLALIRKENPDHHGRMISAVTKSSDKTE